MEANFCGKCGHALTGPLGEVRYCAHCGTPVPGAGAEPVSRLSHNAIAFFCYFIPIAVPVLILNLEPYRRDPALRFHSWQSIYFTFAWILCYFAVWIVALPLMMVGIPFGHALAPLTYAVLLVTWFILLVKSLGGSRLMLPVIGKMAATKSLE